MKNYKKPTIDENNMAKFETVYACSGGALDDSSNKKEHSHKGDYNHGGCNQGGYNQGNHKDKWH